MGREKERGEREGERERKEGMRGEEKGREGERLTVIKFHFLEAYVRVEPYQQIRYVLVVCYRVEILYKKKIKKN